MTSTSDFIDSIINAHGGLECFNAIDSVTVRFQFTGAALSLKQRPNLLQITATVSTHEVKTVFRGLASDSPDEEWIYTPHRVWKYSASTKTVLEARENPRQRFESHERATPWDDFHFVYFIGYALWQYINFPYLLKREDVSARELDPHVESGERWRVLEVGFPPQNVVGSHNATQLFYFDGSLSLRRHDYAPDVFAGSTVSHYTFDEVEAGGLKFPSLRRVVRRIPVEDGSLRPSLAGPSSFLLVFQSYTLNTTGGEAAGMWALKTTSGT